MAWGDVTGAGGRMPPRSTSLAWAIAGLGGRERRAAEASLGRCQPGAEPRFGRGPFAGAAGCGKRLHAAGPVLQIPARGFTPPARLRPCGTRPLSSGRWRCCRSGR